MHGNIELFFFGRVPGYEYLRFINGDGQNDPGLPEDAKVLMVGDARIFYVDRPCDYCVVFSRNPFAEAVERADGSAGGVIAWLQQQGYTHVWANFAEIDRLARTYGMAPQITPDLFVRLERAGLKRVDTATMPVNGRKEIYGILYAVPKS